MERLLLLIALVVLLVTLAGSSALAVSETNPSLAATSIPGSEITTSQNQASNSSASATITITMYAADDE